MVSAETETEPATAFLSTLSAKERDAASFSFDDPERTNWAYVPQSREGLPLKDMNARQREAVCALPDGMA